MAEQLKFWYNELLIDQIATALKQEYSSFNINSFKNKILNKNWENLQLKQRMHRITEEIYNYLPFDYTKQIIVLNKVAPQFYGLTAIVFPNFIEQYGLNHYDISIKALADYTRYSTSEFAIRPFIVKYPKQTLSKMLKWSLDDNYYIRRLASEGCRPLLPWAIKLHNFVKDPTPILSILENLKNDKEDYVYRSVANNLNDISKQHPDLVLKICKKWQSLNNRNTNWLIKHALRTLLKQGNQEAMLLFGFGKTEGITINEFNIKESFIKIGSSTIFNLELINTLKSAKFRFEYTIYYLKRNGSLSQKVFQIKETFLKENEKLSISKKINFKDLTTRKHYVGEHYLALKVNGIELKKVEFSLI